MAACGGAESDASEDDVFRVALLTGGPVSDAGWYAGAYEGLLLLRDQMGAEVSHQQTRTPAEFDEAFLSYASSGYDLVFAHGLRVSGRGDSGRRAIPEHDFLWSVGEDGSRRMSCL